MKHFQPFLQIAFVLPIALMVFVTISNVYDDLQDTKGFTYMMGASQWLTENTEKGSLVFQTDWDDFPSLFFHNTHNTYLIGLDTTYLQLQNPFHWNQWVALTQGLVERPSVVIQDTFGADYVVSDTKHDAFASLADTDPNMELVYRDDNSLIWHIITN